MKILCHIVRNQESVNNTSIEHQHNYFLLRTGKFKIKTSPANTVNFEKSDVIEPPFSQSFIDHDSIPFAGFYYSIANDFDKNIYHAVKVQPDAIDELKNMFKDFHVGVMNSFTDRDNMLKNDMIVMKQIPNIMMEKIK